MELRPGNNEPLYLQLKKILRTAIVNGEYVQGQQIPTEQELMKRYDVSRITVRRAIQELINEKYNPLTEEITVEDLKIAG